MLMNTGEKSPNYTNNVNPGAKVTEIREMSVGLKNEEELQHELAFFSKVYLPKVNIGRKRNLLKPEEKNARPTQTQIALI